MKTVRHPTTGRVVNTVAQSRWERWQTAELDLTFAPQSLLGGAHIHEMYSKPLVRKGLRLASCTKRSQTLGRVRMRGVFM
ncbi:hypothetical protein HMPREF2655_04160 [Streptococcus sp. HMSC066F01]|nr:hypothetical protein HMPREF2655_04160 [Streptococcus sp. HMSC066F01]